MGKRPNQLLLNGYDTNHEIHLHDDGETGVAADICGTSVGGTAVMEFRRKPAKGTAGTLRPQPAPCWASDGPG